jgi:hypothetical protein
MKPHIIKVQKICIKITTVEPLNQGWAIACYWGAGQIYSDDIIGPENLMTLYFV